MQCPLGLRLLADDEKLMPICWFSEKALTRVPQINLVPLDSTLSLLAFRQVAGPLLLIGKPAGKNKCQIHLFFPAGSPKNTSRPDPRDSTGCL